MIDKETTKEAIIAHTNIAIAGKMKSAFVFGFVIVTEQTRA
jgi:hypothetical protein